MLKKVVHTIKQIKYESFMTQQQNIETTLFKSQQKKKKKKKEMK